MNLKTIAKRIGVILALATGGYAANRAYHDLYKDPWV